MSKTVLVCTGKSCRKKKETKSLMRILDTVGRVREVRCQDICSGPVIGCEFSGRLEWYKKIRKPKDIAELCRSLKRDKPTSILQKHKVRKRSGKLKS